jgi:transcriptional regulator GlxA family with amidase domain
MSYNVGIFIHDGVELLDFAGPAEAFTSARNNSGYLFNVFTVAKDNAPILCQNFLTIVPKYSFSDSTPIDILVLPGGDTYMLLSDETIIDWVRRTTWEAKFVLSVCTGVLLLAQAECLTGMRATTHYKWIKFLRETYPDIVVLENVRFIDNGKIITTEGISAGIDGSLYLIEKIFDHAVAADLAHYMMYDWKPEKLNIR